MPGRDVVWLEIASKADEAQAACTHLDKLVVLRTSDWTIIPLENLLACRGGVMLEVKSLEEARLALTVLEKGVEGVVLDLALAARRFERPSRSSTRCFPGSPSPRPRSPPCAPSGWATASASIR